MGYFVRAKKLEVPVWDSVEGKMHYAQGHNEHNPARDSKFQISPELDKRGRVRAFSKEYMIPLDNDGNELPVDEEGNPKWPDLPAPRVEVKLVEPKEESGLQEPPKRRGRPRKAQPQEA